ncbi:MAG: hypothetical protein M3Q86_14055 [Verrucomicrobiota bacterium]|nr:hypothetical protein [Verrucomicrobiota bacterium]
MDATTAEEEKGAALPRSAKWAISTTKKQLNQVNTEIWMKAVICGVVSHFQ